jgi:N,N'-diacetyllegionaminate synthase
MSHTVIIAEAGVNHNGSLELAKKLIDVAARAGADYVKFQTFKSDKIASAQAQKADYQKKTTDIADSQLNMLKKLELSESDHFFLQSYCSEKEIKFLSTAFDLDSIDLLAKLNITLGKIPSGEITNLPYLRKMAVTFEKLILSSGMCNMQELMEAVDVILATGFEKDNLTILHCNTEYPTPFEDVNLRAMKTISDVFNIEVGYSDHTTGIEVPIAAVAMGAKVIEKHFTLDRKMEGPDHKASLEPDELVAMVASIRNIEKALGSSEKIISSSELKNREIARKSIVALTQIEKGEVFSEKNITVKRPGTGISPMMWDKVIGKKAPRGFAPDDFIEI